MTLERIQKEDVYELAAMAREIWTECYVPIIGREQVEYMLDTIQSAEAMAAQMDEGCKYYRICDGGRVGYLAAVPQGERMFLSKLYLKKEARGRGLTSAVVAGLKEMCREKGHKSIYLTVNRGNSQAIAVYAHLGFVKTGEKKADIGNGFFMDDYIMELELMEE